MINTFPHTTILQQTTLNIVCQIIENLYNWMDNLWLKVENIVAKEEIVFSNFFFCHYVFKKPSAAEASESVYMTVRVNTFPLADKCLHIYSGLIFENIMAKGEFEHNQLFPHFDGFMQNGCNYFLNKLQLQPFCMKPSILQQCCQHYSIIKYWYKEISHNSANIFSKSSAVNLW